MRLFFVPFLLAGLTVFWVLTVQPLWGAVKALSWVRTPCDILESEVARSGGKSATYRVKVLYRYEFGGEFYTSKRFDFSTGSSSTYNWKARVVADLPPDRRTECFVNPSHPQEAVLERAPRSEIWFGLFGLPFIAVGCMAFARSSSPVARQRARAAKIERATQEPADESPTGWRVLKPAARRITKAVVVSIFTLFWNAFVWTFVLVLLRDGHGHGVKWGALAFMSIFVLVGLLIALAAIHQVLALFNPTLQVSIEDGPLRLGGMRRLAWELHGGTRRIRKFTVTLEAAEEATYTRGTDTTTERRVFLKEVLYSNEDPLTMASGSVELRVPAGSMHTFKAGRNAIAWKVRFDGEIPRFPDILDEYPLIVQPLASHPPS
jgi:hypothetical protein